MKIKWKNKYVQLGVTIFLVIAASILFYYGIFHMDKLTSGLKSLYSILTPLFYGAFISYIVWPMIRFFEKKVVYRICDIQGWNPPKKLRHLIRMFFVIFSLFLFFMVIYGLLALLIPEIVTSITNIADNFDRYLANVQEWSSNILKNFPGLEQNSAIIFDNIVLKLETWLTQELLPQVNGIVKNFSSGFMGILMFLKNFLLGAMIAIYLLYGKEHYIAHGKRMLYCIFRPETANNVIRDLQYVDRTFGGFIVGKVLDSIIIGILCYIGTSLLNLPYALLVSVIVGVTNVIPFFGPYLGAIPSAFLILLVSPIQCLYFVIFVFVLQQFDGNFLGPKILGDSTGLSSFMVIVAILIGGGLFGIFGMFVGVPFCAVIVTFLRNLMHRRLERKHLPADVTAYKGIDHLHPVTLEPIYPTKEKPQTQAVFSSYRRKKQENQKVEEEIEDEISDSES